ncbi:MAG: LacI family transcriptional regulator [Actinomycetota bacterium]|nr:LacI family transcriptional regulator [Actinomycetota bacterium]
MRVTMREVAAKADVSAMTVSRVINDGRVSEDARRRVEAAIAELGYVPNRLASGLTRRKTGAIGLIVPDVANPFFTLVVRGAEEVAWRAGYHVILCNTQADLERERGYLEDMLAFQVEGLLIAPVGERSKSNLRVPRKNGVPFVLIDRSLSGYHGDLVQGDSIAGSRRLVEHLIGLGHERIAMVTEPGEVSTARDREQGYREALEQAGISFRPEYLVEASAIDPRVAHDATLALLSLPEPPTAIFSVNNIAVVGVAEALRERGLDVPRDVALVCFDDIEHASRFFPFLTVMSQPAESFGTIATQLLLDRLAGRVSERRRLVVLPAEFIVRQSCGAQLVAEDAVA